MEESTSMSTSPEPTTFWQILATGWSYLAGAPELEKIVTNCCDIESVEQCS